MKKHYSFLYTFCLLFFFFIGCKSTENTGGKTAATNNPNLAAKAFTPEKAILLKDNDVAFASKIDIIRNAKKNLRLIYYIIEPDESTSYMMQAIIDKIRADREFKVQILTDYQYNYANLDFFRWLENLQPNGIQQIEVRFYNRPTINVIKFAEFMTLGCGQVVSDEKLTCPDEKVAALKKFDGMNLEEAEKNMSTAAKVFLAGLYAKNPYGLLYATQIGYERTIDNMADSSEGVSMTEEDKEGLKKVAGLYWKAKTSKGIELLGAKLQLGIAAALFGKKLNPVVNSLETFLPFTIKDAENNALVANDDLDYLTDYTHHKFLLSDETSVQIGGRNIANSYHMHPNDLVEKYIFMDTDVFMDLDPAGGKLFSQSFDRLWNFKDMVATTKEIARHAPIGYLYMISALDELAASSCAGQTDMMAQQVCSGKVFGDLLNKGYDGLVKEQQNKWNKKFKGLLSSYTNKYLKPQNDGKSWTSLKHLFNSESGYVQANNATDPLHAMGTLEMPTQEYYYVENLPFSQSSNATQKERSFGSKYGEEVKYGKIIHKVWADAIDKACKESQTSSQPVEVIIHQGYFSPPEGLMRDMDELLDKEICSNVILKLYTNSFYTTDLTPINFIGRRQLNAMAAHNPAFNQSQFEYYEYDKSKLDEIKSGGYPAAAESGGSFSLHSKVMIFGNDIYIGSSNADFRSLMMDTNNGIFLKDADELVKQYKAFLEELETKKIVIPAKATYTFENRTQLKIREKMDIDELMERYDMTKFIDSRERKLQMQAFTLQLIQSMEGTTTLSEEALKKPKLKGESTLDKLLKLM